MNDQVLKLAKQTDVWCDQNYYGDEHYDLRWEAKFAELIINSVLAEVRDEVQYEYDWKLADAVSDRVKKHFGVE